MRTIKLVIEYDGTAYHGFQTQSDPSLPTIQSELERALAVICGEEIRIVGASRTDAGVHAHGQVVSFKTSCSVPADRFSFALNANLPADIRVFHSEQVRLDFHARFDAVGKSYCYFVDNGPFPSVFTRNYAYHVAERLDLKAMEGAAKCFVGEHDFSAFAAAGRSTKTSVRIVDQARLDEGGRLLRFTVSGNGFLYNMVRIMAGTLLEVGRGKLTIEDVKRALKEGERDLAGPTAPAHGLHLMEVRY